ncbi:MAG: OsmC family protein [Kofleriaceae bacterium]
MTRSHDYSLALRWEGNTGTGTTDYRSYSRRYRALIAGKPELVGSADPTFRGESHLHNPEELLVVALSSCHMLSYLALCALRGVCVVDYADRARGTMTESQGVGQFESVVLHPEVTISATSDEVLAHSLHEDAHAACFIARSCNFPISHVATIQRTTTESIARPPAPARYDVAIRLPHRPGTLAQLGEVLGHAGVSLEGGGGFVVGDDCLVHFLVADADRATSALRAAGIDVVRAREVIVQRLAQGIPGQLGKLARAMADAGVNIECVYSDHDNQLVLCVDDLEAGRRVSADWRAATVR